MKIDAHFQRWLRALANRETGIDAAVMLQDVGSEFKRYRTLEPRRVDLASAGEVITLIGPDVSLQDQAAGSRQLLIPDGQACKLEQVNYYLVPDTDAAQQASLEAMILKPLFGGKQIAEFPGFALGDYALGETALRFGAIPLGLWITPDRQFSLTLDTVNNIAFTWSLYVSAVFRLEPRVIIEAAGLLDPWGP